MAHESRRLPVLFIGIFHITSRIHTPSSDLSGRARYSSYIILDDPNVTRRDVTILIDSSLFTFEVGGYYRLRCCVVPPEDYGTTYLYPNPAMITTLRHLGATPYGVGIILMRSRGRVIHNIFEHTNSRWWLHAVHMDYDPELSRTISFEVDYYLAEDTMSDARRCGIDNSHFVSFYGAVTGFTQDGHRWTAEVFEAEAAMEGPHAGLWLLA